MKIATRRISAKTIAEFNDYPNPHMDGQVVTPLRTVDFTAKPTTDESKLNKLEMSWLETMRLRHYQDIGTQDVTLKLGADLRYTPDFRAIVNGRFTFFECKGFFREDSRVKLLATARQFRMFDFYLVTKEKGKWVEVLVKP